MTLTFPRDMITGLRWTQTRLVLRRRQQISTTAEGRINAQDLGPALWRAAEFITAPLPAYDADLAISDFQSLRGSINPFYVYDVTRARPVEMTSEGQFNLSGVTVSAISADRGGLTLTGLPPGFAMTSGDYVSIQTSVGGRELVRVVRAWKSTYDGLGTTPEMEVEPVLRPSVQVDDVVDLVKPMVEMRLEPDSLDDPYVSAMRRRITFSATQVIR